MKLKLIFLTVLLFLTIQCSNEEESTEINHDGEIIIGGALVLVSNNVVIPEGGRLLIINQSDRPVDIRAQSDIDQFDYDELDTDQQFLVNVPANSFGILDLADFIPGEYHFYSENWLEALSPSSGIIEIE
jgi:hypothetical protein